MFLHSYSVSDIEELDSQKLSKRIKYRRKLLNDLRQWFRREYLSELIQKSNEKSSRELKVGGIVLIEDDNKKRLFWPMAKITELIPDETNSPQHRVVRGRGSLVVKVIDSWMAGQASEPSTVEGAV
ncbi:integrase catalytic domain-containing protein [Trichonephila clavipes]|nr:integrase catalytic domain-containing protein [Trichonephila clavipes]